MSCGEGFYMYKFSVYSVIRISGERVIIGNLKKRTWIRMGRTEYKRICDALKEKELSEKYRKKLEKLYKIGVLVESGKDESIREKLNTIMIAITNRCNLRCKHCGFSAGPEETEELSGDNVKKIIKCNKNVGNIIITGGEPLIHPDFFEIAYFLGANFTGKKTLMTNATLINESNISAIIDNFNEVSISLDAVGKDTCDYIRGKGVFDHAMDVIMLLKRNKFDNISLSFVLTEVNKGEEHIFLKLCEELQVKPMIRDFFSMGRGKNNEEELKIREENSGEIILQDYQKHRKNIRFNGGCSAGTKLLYVQFDGRIYPCPVTAVNTKFTMARLEELRDMDLQKIIDDRENSSGYCNFCDISPDKIEHCKECSVKDFCWKCIQEYYTFIASGEDRKVFCKNQKEVLEKIVWGD